MAATVHAPSGEGTPAAEPGPIRRMIVVVDESARSERAVAVALDVADRIGTPVELLGLAYEHVGAGALGAHLADLVRQSGAPVESSSVAIGEDGRQAVGHRLAGDPSAAVTLGGRGRHVLGHDPLGHLTDQLLVEGIPVLIVTAHARMPSSGLPVAACIDATPESLAALPAAARWARALHVPLVLVQVVQPPLQPPQVPAPLATTDDQETAELAAIVRRAAAQWPDLEIQGRVVEYRWAISDALALHFARHPAQLVAVATHRRTWWRRLVHGGVTAHLVDELPTPVLVVPATVTELEPAQGPGEPRTGERPFESVVLPIQPAEVHPAAIRAAFRLARPAGVPVSVVTCDGAPDETMERVRRAVDEVADGTPARWTIAMGDRAEDVAEAILRAATRASPSVVCMSTSAPSRLVDMLVPTVTGSTVRWSAETVVLVGPRCDAIGSSWSEVAACVDGSRISDDVVGLAARWARAFGVPLRVVEVVSPASSVPGAPGVSSRFLARLAERAAEHLQITVSSVVIEAPDPAAALCEWAGDHPDALLVMGCHGVGLSPHPMGRTVQLVVRHSPTPVALLPRAGSRAATQQA